MQNFKKPNLNAPRYRAPKVKLITKQYIKDFKAKYPEHKDVDLALTKRIIKAFNEKLWRETIENRDGIELPENLGYLFIGACQQPTKENIDYGKSIKYGVKVTHKNWDTDGYISKIFYSNYQSRYKLRDRVLWGFTANRYFKRAVTKEFRDNWKKFIVIDKMFTVSKLFDKACMKNRIARQTKEKLIEYNEFDLKD
tara:strand:- start:195 stop:782 length:588 start_codon:yes stop_codon:yes gene_type:complete